jgi:arylsulfatase A-like enzyme
MIRTDRILRNGHSPVEARQAHVVLIMTDDAGYADIGSYGAPDIRTLNIDSLARDGVKLTDFYANAMSCTPTRGLISGRYQQRYGIEFVIPAPGLPGSERGLPPLRHSLPLLMKNNGYTTALIGKWHLGYRPEFSPRLHGFDLFFGYKSAASDYYTHVTVRPGEGAQFVAGSRISGKVTRSSNKTATWRISSRAGPSSSSTGMRHVRSSSSSSSTRYTVRRSDPRVPDSPPRLPCVPIMPR